MPNPGGSNQLGSYQLQPAYGDVKKQTELTKNAPISGSPFAVHATETPRRSQRQVARGGSATPSAASAAGPPGSTPTPQPSSAAALAHTWQELAETPGASPVVQQLAYQAIRQA